MAMTARRRDQRRQTIEQLHRCQHQADADAEFGIPQWSFAIRMYGFDALGDVIAAHASDGEWRLGRISRRGGSLQPIPTSMRLARW